MIKYDYIMIRFGELSTKGKNKKQFIHLLFNNIKHSLKDFPSITIEERYDHIYVKLNDEDYREVIERLQDISGIQAMSLVHRSESDIEVIKKDVLELVKQEKGETFKVTCKRSNKKFPMVSDDIIRNVAPVILKNTSLKVDVHNPDILVSIEVREEGAYIFTSTFPRSKSVV